MSTPTDDQDELLKKLRDLIERNGEKEDTFGSEMADDARVWRVYSKAARKHDKELLDQWNGTLDTLLIFAGLFSSVLTTFIIDSYKQTQID
ncbi:hypothetical protein EXIGLDRAFT_763336 [Exidia glandulosa HHB12029]|uniref:DUF6535 domain-containing protein n=1 Tax=Exidia glandulosa HHB12029 TaxID=1314781 RepID=A0A165M2G1_EXIGL|nr:hypothetical protein EXIGLDRAFT_763336 [Exidia glandulosa HHB12029]